MEGCALNTLTYDRYGYGITIRLNNMRSITVRGDHVLGCYVNPDYKPVAPGRFIRRVWPEERASWGYGLVRHDFWQQAYIMAPIPLNLLLRLAYLAYGWMVYPFRRRTWWERKLLEMRRNGTC